MATKNSSTLPNPLRKAPGRLKEIINSLIDFCRLNRVTTGYGLDVEETANGKQISVNATLQALARAYEADRADTPWSPNPDGDNGDDGGGTITNPTNPITGGNGTGFPPSTGITKDPATGDLKYDGKTLGMVELNVCVDDGNGSFTPKKIRVFGTAPY